MAKRILIVDDEELIRKSLCKLFYLKGYIPTAVKSGEEAVREVNSSDYDLIICDVRMAKFDGIDTIKHIRSYLKKTGKKAVPEILMTGYADADKYQQAQKLKVAKYLHKPFDTEKLLQAIERILRD
ncbi:MAG: response regulator [Candidatus Omnitrophota bacterium]